LINIFFSSSAFKSAGALPVAVTMRLAVVRKRLLLVEDSRIKAIKSSMDVTHRMMVACSIKENLPF
jgi:hypothetical protein